MRAPEVRFVSELAWVIAVPVPCGNCRKEFREIAARLVKMTDAVCPHCGTSLDLDTPQWAAFRDRVKKFSVGEYAPVAQPKQTP